MTIRVGINGFGLIGRSFLRAMLAGGRDTDITVAAINDVADIDTLAHLLKYDSILGRLDHGVTVTGRSIAVAHHEFDVLREPDPSALPWRRLGVDLVVESSGRFTAADKARQHIDAGAKKVIVSAPSNGSDLMVSMGINHDQYDPTRHAIISSASCTINCLAPMAKILHDGFGVVSGLMTTVHAYTNQVLLDGPASDLRRSRAAAVNIVPTANEAGRAVGQIIPELAGKLSGIAVRVPVPMGALVDLVVKLDRDVTPEQVNNAFQVASETTLKGILDYTADPIVSSDIISSPASCILDAQLTLVEHGHAKVVGWFDNVWGFSNRLVDLARCVGSSLGGNADAALRPVGSSAERAVGEA